MSINVGTVQADLVFGTRGWTGPVAAAKQDMVGLGQTASGLNTQMTTVATGASNAGGAFARFGGMATAAIAGLGVGALVGTVSKFVEFTSTIQDSADKLDVSTTAIQRWKFAAEQTGGTLDGMIGAATKLFTAIEDPTKDALEAFEFLGIKVEDLRAMKPEAAFELIATAVGKIPDPMKQVEVGASLMGRGFADNLPAMKQGLKVLGDEAQAAGVIMSEKTVKAGDKLGDTWDKLIGIGGNLIAAVLTPFLPLITSLADVLVPLISVIGKLVEIALTPLEYILGLVAKGIEWLTGAAGDLKGPIETASTVIGVLWDWFVHKLQPVLQPIIDLFKGIGSIVGETFRIIGSIFGSIVGAAGDLFRGVTQWLGAPFLAIFGAVGAGVQGLIGIFSTVATSVIGTARSMYEGVKSWMGDKLGTVWEGVKGATGAVTGFFADMYNKVVGGSYVPDMVRGIAAEFAKLPEIMVAPAERATAKVKTQFENLAGEVRGILSMLGQVVGGTFAAFASGIDSTIGAFRTLGSTIDDITKAGTASFSQLVGMIPQIAGVLQLGNQAGQWLMNVTGTHGAQANDLRDHLVGQLGGEAGIRGLVGQFQNDPALFAAFNQLMSAGMTGGVQQGFSAFMTRLGELGWTGPGGNGGPQTNGGGGGGGGFAVENILRQLPDELVRAMRIAQQSA